MESNILNHNDHWFWKGDNKEISVFIRGDENDTYKLTIEPDMNLLDATKEVAFIYNTKYSEILMKAKWEDL